MKPTLRERQFLISPWMSCNYHRVRVRSDYSVEVQKKPGDPWTLLVPAEVAKRQLSHRFSN